METIIIFAGVIATVTAGVVQVIKKTSSIPEGIMPLISVIVGIAISAATLFIPEINMNLSTGGTLLGGLISGLAASGGFDLVTKTPKDIKLK